MCVRGNGVIIVLVCLCTYVFFFFFLILFLCALWCSIQVIIQINVTGSAKSNILICEYVHTKIIFKLPPSIIILLVIVMAALQSAVAH